MPYFLWTEDKIKMTETRQSHFKILPDLVFANFLKYVENMTNKDIDDINLYNRLEQTCTAFLVIFRKFSFLCTMKTVIVGYCLRYEKTQE